MTTFFTSDTHFNHRNILQYCPGREEHWPTVEDMNEGLIARWNARVGPQDIVWHLGDFALGKFEDAKPIFERLNGAEKHLVLGNHDRTATTMRTMGWTSVTSSQVIVLPGGRRVHIAHHPQTYDKLDRMKMSLQLCGHVHEAWSRAQTREALATWELFNDPMAKPRRYVAGTPDPRGRVINVGVDVRGFEPVTLEELLAE